MSAFQSGGASTSGGGMTGPPQAGIGTQAGGYPSTNWTRSGGGMTGPPQAGIGTTAGGIPQTGQTSGIGWASGITKVASGIGSALGSASKFAAGASGVAKAWNKVSAARYQGEVAEHNAEMMKQEARYQDLRSDIEKYQLLRKTGRLRGKQRAGYSAGGVNPDIGTPAEVGRETWELAEEDIDMIEMQAESAAMGYRGEAAGYQQTADTALSSGMAEASASLLSTTRKLRRTR